MTPADSSLRRRIRTDLLIVLASIAAAVAIALSGAAGRFIALFGENFFFGSFVAGVGFTSVFTTAPASVVLGELARQHGIFPVAFVGAAGALLGDFIIFRFFRDDLGAAVTALMARAPASRLGHVFSSRLFHWLFSLIGAIVIASPLPDEIGLALMGVAHTRTAAFVPISYIMNAAGIMAIGYVARQLV